MVSDLLSFCGVVLLPTFIVIALAGVGSNEYSRYQCSNYERIAGKETRYANFDTCYVKTAQGFQRWDEYKLRAAASEGLRAK